MIRIPVVAVCLALFWTCASAQTIDAGKRLYQARCVGCHGEDGFGGGHGPNIVEVRRPRATTKEAVRDVILKGIPDGGMPAFKVSAEEADAMAAFVMTLKSPAPGATAKSEAAPGDPEAGERFFFGKGNCSGCHMVRGRGGAIGPDLSAIGRERKASQIEQALRDPGGVPATPAGRGGGRGGRGAPSYRAVTVQLRNGQTLRGIAKNESTFDLQLLSVDGKLHLLLKTDVADVVHEKTLMPALKATSDETRDLVAYLSRLVPDPHAKSTLATGEMGPGVPFADVAHPKPGSWPTYHGNESGNRFSSLDQINASNVDRLAPKWMFTIPGAPRSLEMTPVVVEGVMYITSVNEAYALDARSGREIWHYSRPRSQGLAGDAASGINRGVAILGDRVFMVTDNAHVLALHRFTGQLIWDVEMADSSQNYGSTSAPLVVDDMVISGVSGGDEGVRGFLDAYKASTGERVWRFWTIPAAGEPGSETWAGRALEHGCGATWLTGTYDPEAKLLYWPTGNPCPDYNGDERKGDNLYTASVVALDPPTGKLKWYYQFTPHDLHDWDATETPTLVDAEFHGEPRKLMLQGNRNGFFYVLDRLTGKVLVAEPFVKKITWASGIGADGRPILLPGNEPTEEGQLVCPAVAGAANWPSTAFSPATKLFYMFGEESCNVYTKNGEWWTAGKSFYGGGTRRPPADSPSGKFLKAIDIQTGKTAWEIPDIGGGILGSGLMATAGGLIFYGDGSGAFIAADAKNGKLLWHFNTGQSWKAGPMTYMVDGVQYVGVAAGSTIVSLSLAGSSPVAAAPGTPTGSPRQFELKAESPKLWDLVTHDAQLEKIATGFGFTEGPVWDPKGFLWISDETQNKLSRVYPDGRVETVLEIGDPDGSTLDAHGHFVTTASVLRAIIQVEPDGKYKVLADKYEGKKLNSPNDIAVGPDGALYFTDPTLDLVKGEKQELDFQGVFRLGSDGALRLLVKDMTAPNGLAFSPDGKRLYIDDTKTREIRVYDVGANMEVTNGRIFAKEEAGRGAPDGLRVDTKGNVYCTGPGGVWVWDSEGTHIGTIILPESTANFNWGDADYSTIYFASRTSVYRMKTKVRGFVAGAAK
jgi:PQQ-dependent dehydrogenase (methanol/ethanol family)